MAWTPWEAVAGFEQKDTLYDKKYHIEMEAGVARITINCPERMNTYTPRQQVDMEECFTEANEDPMIGVVVLTGAGDRAFCVGGAVEDYLQRAESASQAREGRIEEGESQRRAGPAGDEGMRMCRHPVIARVNGYAIGHGHHLALQCDITIAAEHAIFGHNGPRIASAASGSYISYLTFLIGAKKAREMNFLCRRYTAQEALEMGLVNKVVRFEKLDEEVDKWCEEILQASPTCIEVRKRSFDTQWDLGETTGAIAPGPDFAGSAEAREGPRAFLEKRPANFWKVRKAELEARKKW